MRWHLRVTNGAFWGTRRTQGRAGVSPRIAWKLARRPTMDVFTLVALSDQASAIESLSAPLSSPPFVANVAPLGDAF